MDWQWSDDARSDGVFHVGFVEELLKNPGLEGCDLVRAASARARQVDGKIQCNPPILDHQHTIRQRDGLRHVMGDKDR